MRNSQICLLVLWLTSGCSSSPSFLPADVDGSYTNITLGAPGVIRVSQKFRNKLDRCETIKDSLSITVRGDKGAVPLQTSCDGKAGILVTQTAALVPTGDYSLSLPKNRRRYSVGPAHIDVRYKMADFASSEDMIPEGALALEPGQKLAGEVHYHAGDQTDWVRLKAKEASTSLLFLPSGPDATAEVFSSLPGNSGTKKIGSLTPEKPSRFSLSGGDILVRVRAAEGSGATGYSIVRRDGDAVKKSRVQVVDCYSTGSGMGVAILKVTQGIKVKDGIIISATDSQGKRHTLGKCTVTSVSADEASCELPYSDRSEWVDFKAEGVFSGGQA